MLRLILTVSTLVTLGACDASLQRDVEGYNQLDCVGIDTEIARQKALLNRARQDGVTAIGTAILVDEDLGSIQNEISVADEDAANARLQELDRLLTVKKCP